MFARASVCLQAKMLSGHGDLCVTREIKPTDLTLVQNSRFERFVAWLFGKDIMYTQVRLHSIILKISWLRKLLSSFKILTYLPQIYPPREVSVQGCVSKYALMRGDLKWDGDFKPYCSLPGTTNQYPCKTFIPDPLNQGVGHAAFPG